MTFKLGYRINWSKQINFIANDTEIFTICKYSIWTVCLSFNKQFCFEIIARSKKCELLLTCHPLQTIGYGPVFFSPFWAWTHHLNVNNGIFLNIVFCCTNSICPHCVSIQPQACFRQKISTVTDICRMRWSKI